MSPLASAPPKRIIDEMSGVLSSALRVSADAWRDVVERLRRSTVQVKAGRSGGGSGIIWNSDGLIVTNAHVARGKRLGVAFEDGRVLLASLSERHDAGDIAALRVDASGLRDATIG